MAVLSSANFDATEVKPWTLRFGLGEVAPVDGSTRIYDIDGQHGDDTLVRFRVDQAGIFCDDTEVSLTGETNAGQVFVGTDMIDASDCSDGSCHVY